MSAIWKTSWKTAYRNIDCCLNEARRIAGLPETELAGFKVTVAIKGFELTDEQFARIASVVPATLP